MNELVFLESNQALTTSLKVKDRNGRAIHVGNRVKILAAECNQFLHDSYSDAWVPEMHWDRDEFGKVEIKDGFAQVVDKNGEMLLDLSLYSEDEQEPCLEVVDCTPEDDETELCVDTVDYNT